MKPSVQKLPGVKNIHYLDCSHILDNVALRGICQMPVPVLTAINAVDVCDEAECECQTERNGRSRFDTATLKFLSAEQLPNSINLGFVVTDVDGNSFLIGAKEPPFPQIKMTIRFGLPSGDGAGYFYEVTHVAIKSLIPCTISV